MFYIVRHSLAENPKLDAPDSSRALTAEGLVRAEALVATFKTKNLPVPTLIYHSPYLRTTQTATILSQGLCTETCELAEMAPGYDLYQELSAICAPSPEQHLMIVGHQPQVGMLASNLVGRKADLCAVYPGSVFAINLESWSNNGGQLIEFICGDDLN